MAKSRLEIDLSSAALERVRDEDFVNEAVDVLRIAYAGAAGTVAMGRSLYCSLCADCRAARLWAEVFLRLTEETQSRTCPPEAPQA